MTSQVSPNGNIHEVGIADVFFSVTDNRGVLEHANDLFVSFSRFARDTLVGSPHAMVRHPDMPGAVFHAMWAELLEGRPFAGYVTNLAADGSSYSVYATVTPLASGGFLSVRTRPMDDARSDQVREWYSEVLRFETELRAAGANRREAAAQGAVRLTELLSEAGFASVAAFQQHTLPLEVARFERRSGPFPAHPEATGEAAELLANLTAVDRALGPWSLQQHRLSSLSESLQRAGKQLQLELNTTSGYIDRITAMAGGTLEARLYEPLTIWAQMQNLIQNYVVELITVLRKLDENSAENRFLIALAKLHTRMMASFAVELVDRPKHDDSQSEEIALLGQSLHAGLMEMSDHSVAHRALTEQTISSITKSTSMLSIPRRLLVDWQQQVASAELSPEMRQLAADVANSVIKLGETFTELHRIVELCGEIGTGDDPKSLLTLIDEISPAASGSGAPSSKTPVR